MTGKTADTARSSTRPPVVAVLGHVDHGKTTLLDYIRASHVAASEHGGITQHIGAYQITVGPRTITFIDTPGHEAFSKMRSRGAKVADVVILVVAADDSVKPQTIESIKQIQEAVVPVIVAINKIDLPTANSDRVKQDLAKHGVQVEGFGGNVPVALISGKTGSGVDKLLELVLLVSDMIGLTGTVQDELSAVTVETRLDKGRGMTATLIVKQGQLKRGTEMFAQAQSLGRVRAILDDKGKQLEVALPSQPVEVLGFHKLPQVGVLITSKPVISQEVATKLTPTVQAMPDFLKPVAEQEKRRLNLVLKVDTAGSLEALVSALGESVNMVSFGIGEVSEADILLARSSRAIVVGFNVAIPSSVVKLAQAEQVACRNYTLIYELLDEISDVVAGFTEVVTKERELGKGKIIAEFPFSGQRVAGTKVTEGRIARGDQVKIMRGEEETSRGRVKTLKKSREDVTRVEAGSDCGVLFDKKIAFEIGDVIIAFTHH